VNVTFHEYILFLFYYYPESLWIPSTFNLHVKTTAVYCMFRPRLLRYESEEYNVYYGLLVFKTERDRVDTVPLIGWGVKTFSFENMTEVTTASSASDLNTGHPI